MKKAIVLCLLLVSFAMSQKYVTVVLPTLALDPETRAKLTPQQLDIITEDVRDIVAKHNTHFNLMKQDEVKNKLGDEAFVEGCKEGSCVGDFVSKVEADLGARCDVYTANGQMYMKFELYGTLKGDSIARTINQFSNEEVKSFAEVRARIKAKVPAIIEEVTKTPQQICDAKGKGWMLVGGVCKSLTEIAREKCDAKGKEWTLVEGECKSLDQIACESTKGRQWVEDEKACKTPQQICEGIGNVWLNGVCKAPTFAAPVPLPQQAAAGAAAGGFFANITTIPSGATLKLNGQPYPSCPKTPCSISTYDKTIRIAAILGEYKIADTTFTIMQPGQLVTIKLEPDDYTVYFESDPSGVLLSFNGEANRQCPRTPCRAELKKGSVKVTATPTSNLYEAKDTTIHVLPNDKQQVKLNLSGKYGTLAVKTKGDGWSLTVDGTAYSISGTKLLPGHHKAKLTHELYEDIDFNVEIKKGVNTVFDASDKLVHRFGYLKIKPDDYNWVASIDGRSYNSRSLAPLLPGVYQAKLTDECYEDIDFEAEIKRGENSVIDVSEKMKPKTASLGLYVKYKGREQKEPVFIDGKEAGRTPFKELVPACSDFSVAEVGNDKVKVDLGNLKNGGVEYTYNLPTLKSTLLSVALGTVGVVLLYNAYSYNSDQKAKVNDYMNEYNRLNSPYLLEYDNLRKNATDANDKIAGKTNLYLITGGAFVVSAVGVYLWF
ncbi:MAG: hypothetical protein FWF67_03980 [Fibromonadales bacterium]|nr:hypothetical protein [Fibromonadales bacterium]